MASITSIVYQTEASQHTPPYRYNRSPIEAAQLLLGHGIEGDLKGGQHPKRQLNIMCAETMQALAQEGYSVAPGELGEQIIIDGLVIENLELGTCLQIGAEAQVELVEARKGCDWFEQIHEKPKQNTVGRLGMMAIVKQPGAIRVGDTVQVIPVEVKAEA